MAAAICCRIIEEPEEAAAEEVGVLAFGCRGRGSPPAVVGGAGSGVGRAAGGGQEDECGRRRGQSIANSRQKTTSKLKVFAVRRVSITSAIRVNRAGMPRIFSWAFLPISLRPSIVSIFQ